MSEDKKIYRIKKIFVVFVLSMIFFIACKSLVPYLLYDDTEVTHSTGNILVSLKELQILEPNKLTEFNTYKKYRFADTNTSMSFKFDYSDIENQVQPYYLEQANSKNWNVVKVTDNQIILEKERQDNLINLNFEKQKDKTWVLKTSYRRDVQ